MIIDTFSAWGPTASRTLEIRLSDEQKEWIDHYLTKLPADERIRRYAYDRLAILAKMVYYKSQQFEKEAFLIIKETQKGLWCGIPQTTRRLVKWDGKRYSRERNIKLIRYRQKNRVARNHYIAMDCKAKKLKLNEW